MSMTPILGLDADQDLSKVAGLAYQRNARWAGRYLKDAAKGISAKEVVALHGAGLAVLLIWETTAERALAGAAAGTTDGETAAARAKTLGAPAGIRIAVTNDFDPEASQVAVAVEYHQAAQTALAAEGFGYIFYGSAVVGEKLTDAPMWVPNNKWSDDQAEIAAGKVAIVQETTNQHGLDNLGLGNGAIDANLAYVDDLASLGLWMPATAAAQVATPATTPTALPPSQPTDTQAVVIPGPRATQTELARLQYYKAAIDGKFGELSQAALAAYYVSNPEG